MKTNYEVRYAAHPEDAKSYDTERLRRDFLIERVRKWDVELFLEDDAADGSSLAMRLAVMANLLKLSAEKLLGATEAEAKPKKGNKEKKK